MSKKINAKNDGKPLSADISGKYKYNNSKNEYIFLNKKFNNSEKKPYNIRLANFKNCLWVNHTDYTAIQCDYIPYNDSITFTFNDVTYSIPKVCKYDEVIGEYVYIKKV